MFPSPSLKDPCQDDTALPDALSCPAWLLSKPDSPWGTESSLSAAHFSLPF